MNQNKSRAAARRPKSSAPYAFNSHNVPDAQYVTLTYSDTIDAAATANNFQYQWRLNSPYDCNYTSTGTQPSSFDEWAALYVRYTVFSVSVDVRVVNRQAGSVAYTAFVMDSTNSAPTYSGASAAAQQRHAVSAETQYGAPPARLKMKRDVGQVFGVPWSTVDADDNFSASTTANPSNTLWGSCAIYTAGATDAISIFAVIKMKIRFWRPQSALVSLAAKPPVAELEELAERLRAEGGEDRVRHMTKLLQDYAAARLAASAPAAGFSAKVRP